MTVFRSPISTQARATELLEALGSTAEKVAATLTAGGHLGPRDDCETCPVADYLMRSDLHASFVAVGVINVHVYFVENGKYLDRVDMPTPGPVADFIQRFDGGGFPELVKGGVA